MRINKNYILFFIILCVFFITACSPESRYKVLSFLFDGVPDPNFTELIDGKDSLSQIDSTKIISIVEADFQKTYFHQPYLEKNCAGCHDNNKGILPQPDLCYTCHANFEYKYSAIHGPVAGGYCTSCHDPHKSKMENLLLRNNQDLCLHCHDPEHVAANDLHSMSEITDCLECHNPHGEENKFLVKDGACYVCHDDFSKSYTFLHGPVAGGFCNSCHDTHMSESPHKLLLTGQDLCLKCHKKESVFKNENHDGIEEFDCMECHNPHGGADKYLLN